MPYPSLRAGSLAGALLLAACAPQLQADPSSPPPQPTVVLEPIVQNAPVLPQGAFNISQVEVKPVPLVQGPPHFPDDLRTRGIAGDATVDFVIDKEGLPQHVVAFRASDRRFAEAAVAAVEGWRFKPGLIGGKAVVTRLEIPIVFALSDDQVETPEGPERHGLVQEPTPPMPSDAYDISKVDRQPLPIKQVRPRYPYDLRQRHIEGMAMVLFIVDRNGNVVSALSTQATDAAFADSAVAAVLQWKFRPAEVKGKTVNCRLMVPLNFSLNR